MNPGDPIHRKLCRRWDIPWQAHCLTFSCFKRMALLKSDRARLWTLEALDLGRRKGMYHLWAYVIMPEHVHLVLLPLGETLIHEILTTVKQSVAKRALNWLASNAPGLMDRLLDVQPNGRRHHRFWQRGGGYDRNLRSAKEVHEKIQYTHENPVRRELVSKARDWLWSSALAYETGIDEPMPIDRSSIPLLVT